MKSADRYRQSTGASMIIKDSQPQSMHSKNAGQFQLDDRYDNQHTNGLQRVSLGCTQLATGTADVKAHTNEWQHKYRDQQKCTENSPYFAIRYYHIFVVRTAMIKSILKKIMIKLRNNSCNCSLAAQLRAKIYNILHKVVQKSWKSRKSSCCAVQTHTCSPCNF